MRWGVLFLAKMFYLCSWHHTEVCSELNEELNEKRNEEGAGKT